MASEPEGFTVADFVVFFGILTASALIGVYYAIKDRTAKRKTIDNYNYGGRSMSPIPLGLSIAVTYMSALTMIGFSTESYTYGAVVGWYLTSPIISNTIACVYYIPFIHKLNIHSIFEYLERRFDVVLRKLVSAVFILRLIFYMGVTVFIPALALNAVTPLSLDLSIVITSGICTFYTSLGGMKAVVWTDTLQAVIMFVGGFAALVKTVILVGGFGNVFDAMERGGRLNMWDFSLDPTLQRTFWTATIGWTFTRTRALCLDQASAQRYLSCKSVKDARKAVLFAIFPILAITAVAIFSGFAAYAYFENCDPLKSGKIVKPDQLIAYLVTKVFYDTPGMSGLFVSAAFSGTLSTVSSGINSVGSVILEDFVLPWKPHLSEPTKVTISKITGILIGCLVLVLAFAAKNMDGTVNSIMLSINGSLGGPILGIFTLGVFFPWTNTIGALSGQIIATIFVGWIGVSSVIYGKPADKLRKSPTSIEGCLVDDALFNYTTPPSLQSSYYNTTNVYEADLWNNTTLETTIVSTIEKPSLYNSLWSLSFLYMSTLSFILTVLIGLTISFITGANDPSRSNPRYFIPFIDNQLLPQNIRTFFRFGVPEDLIKDNQVDDENNLPFLDVKNPGLSSKSCAAIEPLAKQLCDDNDEKRMSTCTV